MAMGYCKLLETTQNIVARGSSLLLELLLSAALIPILIWFTNHFLCHTTVASPLLLLLDGHSSHHSLDTTPSAAKTPVVLHGTTSLLPGVSPRLHIT